MRIHPNLVKAITAALDEIFTKGQQADSVVPQVLKSDSRWGSRDRRFVAGAIYDIVRHRRKYAAVAQELMGTHDHSSCFWVWAAEKGHDLPDWDEVPDLDMARVKQLLEKPFPRAVRESIPDWLDAVCERELGSERWEAELQALNRETDVILRVNTMLTYRERLQKWLTEEGLESEILTGFPDALRLKKRASLKHLKAYRLGHFEIQDANSQMVASMVDPKEGEFIIDTCAGAGGKSLHLACLMKDKGDILALDIHHKKLKELKKRARRNRLQSIRTLLVDRQTDLSEYHGKADKVLVDAPCSGLGTLRRNPDIKWKLSESKLNRYRDLQQRILRSYAALVKSGGALVYATCSILPSENQEQLKSFLASESGKAFKLTEEYTLWPSVTGFDGFYMAQLISK